MSRTRTRRTPAAAAIAESAWDSVRDGVKSRPWWVTALIIIGFVALLMAIGVLFFGIDDTPRDLVTSDTVPPVESEAFALALSGLVGAPMEQGGTVEVLNDGDEFIPSLLQSLRGARTSINFSVY